MFTIDFCHYKNLKNLQLFSFVHNNLTVPLDGMDNLISTISVNHNLKAFGLGGSALKETNIIAMIKAIKHPRDITHLKFEDCPLHTPLIKTLSDLQVRLSSGLKCLTLSNCSIMGEEICHWLVIFSLKQLTIYICNNPIGRLGIELVKK